MPSKRQEPEGIVAKLRQVDVLTSQGRAAADAIRSIGVSEAACCRWRQEFGGLEPDQAKRLEDLEAENARLRRAIPDLTLGKQILAEAARGRVQAPRAVAPVRRSVSAARHGARRRGAVMMRSR